MRTVATDIHEHLKTLNKQVLVVHVAKGLELNSYKRVSEVLSEVFDDTNCPDICVLSGPSHVKEVVEKQPIGQCCLYNVDMLKSCKIFYDNTLESM